MNLQPSDSKSTIHYDDSSNVTHGYLDIGGVITTIDVPGASNTRAYGFNGAGNIVGSYDFGGFGFMARHGYLDIGGVFTTIDGPQASTTEAYDINDAGHIVGTYGDSSGVEHGFLDIGGVITTIDVPGAGFTWAVGINDTGQIVGYYRDSSGVTHGYLATVPEPSGLVLLETGAVGLLGYAARRRSRLRAVPLSYF